MVGVHVVISVAALIAVGSIRVVICVVVAVAIVVAAVVISTVPCGIPVVGPAVIHHCRTLPNRRLSDPGKN